MIAVTVKFSKIDKINAFVYNRWNNDIIMFLHNNPHHNTAAEIVRIRKSTKSHVSSSLKKLENKGLIKKNKVKIIKNISHDEDGSSHHYFFWMLSSGNTVQ